MCMVCLICEKMFTHCPTSYDHISSSPLLLGRLDNGSRIAVASAATGPRRVQNAPRCVFECRRKVDNVGIEMCTVWLNLSHVSSLFILINRSPLGKSLSRSPSQSLDVSENVLLACLFLRIYLFTHVPTAFHHHPDRNLKPLPLFPLQSSQLGIASPERPTSPASVTSASGEFNERVRN